RPRPSAPVSTSDIEERDVLRVLLDEEATRLDLIAHQHREELVGGARVLDVYPDEQPLHGIHRRLPQLIRVHLAETLVARELDSGAPGELECLVSQLRETLRLGSALPERERERRRPDDVQELAVGAAKILVDRRGEQLGGEADGLRCGRLLLDDLHLEALLVALEHRELVAVRRERADRLLE